MLAEEIICLPVGWWLTDDDRKRIVKTADGVQVSFLYVLAGVCEV